MTSPFLPCQIIADSDLPRLSAEAGRTGRNVWKPVQETLDKMRSLSRPSEQTLLRWLLHPDERVRVATIGLAATRIGDGLVWFRLFSTAATVAGIDLFVRHGAWSPSSDAIAEGRAQFQERGVKLPTRVRGRSKTADGALREWNDRARSDWVSRGRVIEDVTATYPDRAFKAWSGFQENPASLGDALEEALPLGFGQSFWYAAGKMLPQESKPPAWIAQMPSAFQDGWSAKTLHPPSTRNQYSSVKGRRQAIQWATRVGENLLADPDATVRTRSRLLRLLEVPGAQLDTPAIRARLSAAWSNMPQTSGTALTLVRWCLALMHHGNRTHPSSAALLDLYWDIIYARKLSMSEHAWSRFMHAIVSQQHVTERVLSNVLSLTPSSSVRRIVTSTAAFPASEVLQRRLAASSSGKLQRRVAERATDSLAVAEALERLTKHESTGNLNIAIAAMERVPAASVASPTVVRRVLQHPERRQRIAAIQVVGRGAALAKSKDSLDETPPPSRLAR